MSGQIDRWWVTAGEDARLPVTWTVTTQEDGDYWLGIDSQSFLRQPWSLSSDASVTVKALSSGSSSPSPVTQSTFSTADPKLGKISLLGSLKAGTYQITITDFVVPADPSISEVQFSLGTLDSSNDYDKELDFGSLFIADHPDGAEAVIDKKKQYEKWIDEYAPILLFDAGKTSDSTDNEQFAVPVDVSETWEKDGKSIQLTGESDASFDLSAYDNQIKYTHNGMMVKMLLDKLHLRYMLLF